MEGVYRGRPCRRRMAAFSSCFRFAGTRGRSRDTLYPDSNRVFSEIMGSKPIRKRGHLVKVGEKRYRLTTSGREVASKLLEADGLRVRGRSGTSGGKATMSRGVRGKLERLLKSRAVQRAQASELERITFHDACVFWGITSASTAIELEGSFANIEAVIATAERSIRSGASELRTGSNDLSSSTTALLRRVHTYLREAFGQPFTPRRATGGPDGRRSELGGHRRRTRRCCVLADGRFRSS